MAELPPPPPAAALPALHASHGGCWLRETNQPTRTIGKGEGIMAAADTPLLFLNAPLIASRLGYPDLSGLDLLELFAFVRPAQFVVPTPKGLAQALNLVVPASDDGVPLLLQQAAAVLFAQCESPEWPERDGAWSSLQSLLRMRWPWGPLLEPKIARPEKAERWLFGRLPEWDDAGERPQPAQVTLDTTEVLERLSQTTGKGAEQRPTQQAYSTEASHVFRPRAQKGQPHVLLAQAGTGIGKTLGYLAPASVWSEKSGGTTWVSTYTKALQRQLRRESARAWPQKRADGSPPVVVRKGRENYLCLLNLEDATQGAFKGRAAILAHLIARWTAYTQDGDMIGGDLPGWLGTLFRQRGITALTDRRGECIYAGCPHFRKCFIERASRDSAQADLVIANHALVMINAARGRENGQNPTRIIFDEGHHVFDAADSTFAAALTGSETIELRRWVLGPERNSKGRRRGLSARLSDMASYDDESALAITDACAAASLLPSDGWLQRVVEGEPEGPIEKLFAATGASVFARDESGGQEAGYGLETEASNLDAPFLEAVQEARTALGDLCQPLVRLHNRLETILTDPPDWLDGQGRARIEGARHSLKWRTDLITAWESLLVRLCGVQDPEFVDWLAVERSDAREFDIGIHRRWLDPMKPFSKTVLEPAHGVMLTSATLKNGKYAGNDTSNWQEAIQRSGTQHIGINPRLSAFESPFHYASQAEVLIITDVPKGDIPALANAYGRIIETASGGVLGLFTAIRRMRAVYGRILDRLARGGLPLYAQHVDPIDTGTLVDIFRDDPHASLLGTDALRDGVDVTGHSLRLVVMEQVPWPKPSILHRARRMAGGGSTYDDSIIRARLAQAFGRLIRSSQDQGHFVMLSSAFPSRLLSAFPEGTPILRLTLEEALERIAKSPNTPNTDPINKPSAQPFEAQSAPRDDLFNVSRKLL